MHSNRAVLVFTLLCYIIYCISELELDHKVSDFGWAVILCRSFRDICSAQWA